MTDRLPTSPFRVLLRDLPAHRRFEVGAEYVAGVLAGMPMREPVRDAPGGDAAMEVELYLEGEHVHLSGAISGHVIAACSRCVGPASVPFAEDIHATFLPQSELAAQPEAKEEAEDGVELAAEELDVYAYEGESIDVEPLIREQLVLAVPYAPLCREDCKGLCPQCGVDRNVDLCACAKPIDPRFEALKGLKLPS